MNNDLTIPADFRPAFARLREEFHRQRLPPKLLDRNLQDLSWRILDHLPLWVEFLMED